MLLLSRRGCSGWGSRCPWGQGSKTSVSDRWPGCSWCREDAQDARLLLIALLHPEKLNRLAIIAAIIHTLIIAAYTMPAQWVPLRARYWSQAYARVLFHQDWRLFAPDPPACLCELEVWAGRDRKRLDEMQHHFIWRRMAANACRFAEASPRDSTGAVLAPSPLALSLMNMAGEVRSASPLQFRMLRNCADGNGTEVTDVKCPDQR